jgi:signal transduction histidine kinase
VIENALKYSKPGIDNPYVSIFIYDSIPNRELKIVVKDNGIGIPARIKDKVFEMFFRGTQICKGSGLGLYIVKNAVEKLNGSIQLMSTENVGTTLEINLPIFLN